MKKRVVTKKRVAVMTVLASVLGAAAAFAWFSSAGAGSGSAKTGSAASLTITQVGAGYDSLVSSNTYTQDQCFSCAGITAFGNAITLANTGAQELANVVVAIDNWDGAVTNLPMTLTIFNTVNGTISDTQDFNFPAATGGATPTEKNITFDFSSQGAFVEQELVYQITFDSNPSDSPNGSGLNVALSSSVTDLSVGTDTNPGTIWLETTPSGGDLGASGDFPPCVGTVPVATWEQVSTDCGPWASGDPGAYGNEGAASQDIPAVEVNVVGGIVPPLYPGGPSQPVDFAITNPGTSSVHVDEVTTTATSLTGAGTNAGIEACSTSMYPLADDPVTINADVLPGTTIFSPSGTTISMTDDGNNQDNCEGATVNLSFSSN